MSQTTVADASAGFKGMLGSSAHDYIATHPIISTLAAGVAKFGLGITINASGQVSAVGGIDGFLVFPDAAVHGTEIDDVGYLAKADAMVLRQGLIWAVAGEALAIGDPVFVVNTTGEIKKTDATATATAWPGNSIVRAAAAAAGDPVLIEVW